MMKNPSTFPPCGWRKKGSTDATRPLVTRLVKNRRDSPDSSTAFRSRPGAVAPHWMISAESIDQASQFRIRAAWAAFCARSIPSRGAVRQTQSGIGDRPSSECRQFGHSGAETYRQIGRAAQRAALVGRVRAGEPAFVDRKHANRGPRGVLLEQLHHALVGLSVNQLALRLL